MGLARNRSVIAGANIDHAAEQISPLCYVRPNPALWNVLKPRLEASFRQAAGVILEVLAPLAKALRVLDVTRRLLAGSKALSRFF
jgi:hypothetical protein